MNACWKESSRRLGLSWSKQVKQGQDGIDLAKPFRLVRNDLALLIPVPEDLTNLSRPESQPSLQTALALNESGSAGLGTGWDAVDPGGEKPPLLNVSLIEAWMEDEGWINKTLAQKLQISELRRLDAVLQRLIRAKAAIQEAAAAHGWPLGGLR